MSGRALLIALSLLWLAELLAGCVGNRPAADSEQPQTHATVKQIFVVNHGKHTGIIFDRQDIPVYLWPEQLDFTESKYLEVGWGDLDYYQSSEPHLGILLKAILIPTPAVLHVAGFSRHPLRFFPGSQLVELKLTPAQFARLVRYIAGSFAKNGHRRATPLQTGLYGISFFYLSRERYHLFKTCNVWVAKALAAAGQPVHPLFAVTAGGLMSQLPASAKITGNDSVPLDGDSADELSIQ